MNHAYYLLKSLRPYQWAKNILLFAGLFFSLSFFNFPLLFKAFCGFFSFAFASSAIYLFNDIKDIEKDRLHPVKKNRPIASGKVSIKQAWILAVGLFILSVFIAWFFINTIFILIILTYLIINLFYTLYLKHIIILDVIIISVGFLLRALAGNVAIEVKGSMWLFICTFMLALLFSLGKRRIELAQIQQNPEKHRKSLREYDLAFIDNLLNIVIAASIVTYSLYTMSEETVKRFDTEWLIYTTPVVIYGLFRYLYLIQYKNKGDDPTRVIFSDKHLIITGLVWIILIVGIIYLKLQLRFYSEFNTQL